tara:strand:- start:718 stop:1284 length:567 start_codon:yes stop_codon:yes gene_type:complete
MGVGANMAAGGDYVDSLPGVADPDAAFAQMTRDDYMNYVKDFRDFEEELLDRAQTDTSLIDQSKEDTKIASQLTKDVMQRNMSRYGASLTPAQLQQQNRTLERQNTLGGINSLSNARLAQKEMNASAINDLINIGQGINRSSLQQMQGAAANHVQRENAYDQAKAASKAQTFNALGSLGAMAIFATAF